MKSMRELINLMESTEAQMQTASEVGSDEADSNFDASQSGNAQEVDEAHVDTCRQSNPADCRTACAMEENVDEYATRLNALNRNSPTYGKEYDQLLRDMPDAHNAYVKAQDDRLWAGNNWQADPLSHRSAVDESFNNGYDEIHVADGQDYFPNGADGPVVKAVGPSGAKQGDNPEQKKMQIAEVHKELVYSYRNYLKESASSKPKKGEKPKKGVKAKDGEEPKKAVKAKKGEKPKSKK